MKQSKKGVQWIATWFEDLAELFLRRKPTIFITGGSKAFYPLGFATGQEDMNRPIDKAVECISTVNREMLASLIEQNM